MNVQLTVAVISAVVAFASILLSARNTKSNAEFQARLQRENNEFQIATELRKRYEPDPTGQASWAPGMQRWL